MPLSTSSLSIKATQVPFAYKTAGLSFSASARSLPSSSNFCFLPRSTPLCLDLGALLLLRDSAAAEDAFWVLAAAFLPWEVLPGAARAYFVWDLLRVSLSAGY